MTALTENDTFFEALATFFKDRAEYLLTGGSPPSLSGVTGSLSYPELLSYLNNNLSRPSTFSLGAAEESLFTMAAIRREIDMAVLSKGSIYGDISSVEGDDSNYYASLGSFLSGVLSGSSTNGSMA